MTIILDIYLGPKWNFARNHLNISTYNDENFKPVFFFFMKWFTNNMYNKKKYN